MATFTHDSNVDLHCHTTASDGTLDPVTLVTRAAHNGVQWLAITDHDDTSSIEIAQQQCRELGIRFTPGVEISVTFCGKTVHIVGLGIDPQHTALHQGLHTIRSGRDGRAAAMAASLEQAGYPGSYEGALKYVGNPSLVSRTHFARHLVATGVCDTTQEVFQKFLTEGKPGYVPHEWAGLAQAVEWIKAAGGIAVLAHPGRYKYNATQRWALLSEFKDAGGAAIEVVTGSHTTAQYTEYAKLASEFGFAASRGSDFHSPTESRIDLGKLPPLPTICTAVWEKYESVI